MQLKIQPTEYNMRCIFDGIASKLPIMRCAYVALTLLAILFCMAWYQIVVQRPLVVYSVISHMSLVFSWYTHLPEDSWLYRENTSESWDIPRYTNRKPGLHN